MPAGRRTSQVVAPAPSGCRGGSPRYQPVSTTRFIQMPLDPRAPFAKILDTHGQARHTITRPELTDRNETHDRLPSQNPPASERRSEQQTHLINMIMLKLELNTRVCHIKTECAAETGLKPRSIERYIRKARQEIESRDSQQQTAASLELLILLEAKQAEQLFAESVNFYQSIIANPNTGTREQLHARERLDKLLGLYR